ncbi:MAG: VanW family protein [Firmicutes bacterium]|nr:VanW family protein [Bacillota bacterium]
MLKDNLFKKFFAAAVVLCFCFSSTLSIAITASPPPDAQATPQQAAPAPQASTFAGNLYLDNIDLSSLTYFGANARFGQITAPVARGFLVSLSAGGQKYEIRAADVGFRSNSPEQLNQLWAYSRTNAEGPGERLFTTYFCDNTKAQNAVDRIVKEACPDSVPAFARQSEPVFDFESREFTAAGPAPEEYFDPETVRGLLTDGLARAVAYANEHRAAPVIELTAKPVKVTPAATDVSGYGLLASYSTRTTNVANRNTNISLACAAVSGATLAPGDTFSFLGAVGETTEEKGYKVAGILVDGKPDEGIGGGICQVSSTLYNAVLDAGLKVVERHPHSAPVGYVPKDRDATVSLPRTDFRFRNDTDSSVYIVMDYDNRTVTASLYGKLP